MTAAAASPSPYPAFRVLADRILVKPDEPDPKIGRIIVPDSAKKKGNTGVVVGIGPGMPCADGSRWPMPDVKLGDKVVFHKEGSVPVKLPEGEFLSLRDDFVLAVIEEE